MKRKKIATSKQSKKLASKQNQQKSSKKKTRNNNKPRLRGAFKGVLFGEEQKDEEKHEEPVMGARNFGN